MFKSSRPDQFIPDDKKGLTGFPVSPFLFKPVGEKRSRNPEIQILENIKGFGAQLQTPPFGELEVAPTTSHASITRCGEPESNKAKLEVANAPAPIILATIKLTSEKNLSFSTTSLIFNSPLFSI